MHKYNFTLDGSRSILIDIESRYEKEHLAETCKISYTELV